MRVYETAAQQRLPLLQYECFVAILSDAVAMHSIVSGTANELSARRLIYVVRIGH